MQFFTKNRSSKKRIIEEWVYERVADELEVGQIRKGLWTKARGLSEGDANKCESIYIQLRAESIVDDAKINYEIQDYPSTKKAKEEYERKTENEQLREKEKYRKQELQEKIERQKSKDELAIIAKRDRVRAELSSFNKLEVLPKLLSNSNLKSVIVQDGEFQVCLFCDLAKTRNKAGGIPICNVCLVKDDFSAYV